MNLIRKDFLINDYHLNSDIISNDRNGFFAVRFIHIYFLSDYQWELDRVHNISYVNYLFQTNDIHVVLI